MLSSQVLCDYMFLSCGLSWKVLKTIMGFWHINGILSSWCFPIKSINKQHLARCHRNCKRLLTMMRWKQSYDCFCFVRLYCKSFPAFSRHSIIANTHFNSLSPHTAIEFAVTVCRFPSCLCVCRWPLHFVSIFGVS